MGSLSLRCDRDRTGQDRSEWLAAAATGGSMTREEVREGGSGL